MYHFIDFLTKERVFPNNLVFTGKKNPWELIMDLELIRSKLNVNVFRKAPPSLGKYLPFLPIKDPSRFVTLKEVATPLVSSRSFQTKSKMDVLFKIEGKNPTGSFKDRGSAVELTTAQEMGAKAIALASTGNMAASCSCYAAAARLPCFVFVPQGVPRNKLAQVIAFGGKIIEVKGDYNDAAQLAETVSEEMGFYLAGDYAFRTEGQKTAAFELADQLGFDVPDIVVLPIGCGTNLAAYAKGFKEYFELGLIEKIPKLVGVQAEGAAAIVHSFEAKKTTIRPLPSASSIASAIAISNPIDGTKALEAIYQTNGFAISVSDPEILRAQGFLASQEGLFVETASASAFAAVVKMGKNPEFAGKRIVCVLTGDGLKDPSAILKEALDPPLIDANRKAFCSLYESGAFDFEPSFAEGA